MDLGPPLLVSKAKVSLVFIYLGTWKRYSLGSTAPEKQLPVLQVLAPPAKDLLIGPRKGPCCIPQSWAHSYKCHRPQHHRWSSLRKAPSILCFQNCGYWCHRLGCLPHSSWTFYRRSSLYNVIRGHDYWYPNTWCHICLPQGMCFPKLDIVAFHPSNGGKCKKGRLQCRPV
jgi:hypothetical protein